MSLKIKLILSSLFLALSILLTVSISFYIIISKLWREQDYDLLETQVKHFSQLYYDNILDSQFIKESQMVLVFSASGEKKFIHYPKNADSKETSFLANLDNVFLQKKGIKTVIISDTQEKMNFLERLEYKLLQLFLEKRLLFFASFMDDDFFEIYTEELDNGEYIVVGKFSEEREESLADLRSIAGQLIIPCLLITIILSWFMAKVFLSPILELVDIIKRIKIGEKNLRPQISSSKNEIDILKKEFSSLMDQNNALIDALKETLDNVAHDLKTPLTHFRMSTELALTNNHSEKELKDALAEGIEASDHILRLLKSLMDIQEIESKVFYLKIESLDLKDLIKEVIDMYSFLAEEKKLKFNIDIEELMIQADRLRIFQAIANLIDNAIKYSHANKQITIESKKLNQSIQIIISDEGIGISEQDLPKIWDRLYRADPSRTAKGAGIGLSLVKAYILAHDGTIEAYSKLGSGSKFIITLPIRNEMVRNS